MHRIETPGSGLDIPHLRQTRQAAFTQGGNDGTAVHRSPRQTTDSGSTERRISQNSAAASPTMEQGSTRLPTDPLAEKYYSYSPYAFCNNNPVNLVDLDGRDTIYVFDTPYRPNDKGVYGETYTAETYVEINGKLSGPYRSSSYPNSRSNADNSTPYNTVLEAIMINFNNKYGHNGGSDFGLNLVDENGNRKIEGISPDGNKTEMTLVNVHSGKSDKGNYNSRGSKGCITIHPDDAAAFFGNFKWNSGKHSGVSQGKIIVFRTLTPHKEKEYNRIKQR